MGKCAANSFSPGRREKLSHDQKKRNVPRTQHHLDPKPNYHSDTSGQQRSGLDSRFQCSLSEQLHIPGRR